MKNYYFEQQSVFDKLLFIIFPVSMLFLYIAGKSSGIQRTLMLVMGVLILVAYPFLIKWIKKRKKVNKSRHIGVSEEGIYFFGERRLKRVMWKDIESVKDGKNKIVIYSRRSAPLSIKKNDFFEFERFFEEIEELLNKNHIEIKKMKREIIYVQE